MKVRMVGCFMIILLAACGTEAPAPTIQPEARFILEQLQISDVWARPVAVSGAGNMMHAGTTEAMTETMNDITGGMMNQRANGAVYMQLSNIGAADRLISAESAVAEVVELHSVEDTNGVMAMRQVDGIDIPANGATALEPGGFHVMLIGVKEELEVGETFMLRLTFEQSGSIGVPVNVRHPAVE